MEIAVDCVGSFRSNVHDEIIMSVGWHIALLKFNGLVCNGSNKTYKGACSIYSSGRRGRSRSHVLDFVPLV